MAPAGIAARARRRRVRAAIPFAGAILAAGAIAAAGPNTKAAGPDKGNKDTQIEHKVMKNDMNQVQVPPFGLSFC